MIHDCLHSTNKKIYNARIVCQNSGNCGQDNKQNRQNSLLSKIQTFPSQGYGRGQKAKGYARILLGTVLLLGSGLTPKVHVLKAWSPAWWWNLQELRPTGRSGHWGHIHAGLFFPLLLPSQEVSGFAPPRAPHTAQSPEQSWPEASKTVSQNRPFLSFLFF